MAGARCRAEHPLTIPEILDANAELAQSSVYRNLVVLERSGVVSKVVTTNEWSRYELAEDLTGHHHHLICSSCGAVRDVDVPEPLEASIDAAFAALAAEHGFTLDDCTGSISWEAAATAADQLTACQTRRSDTVTP